MSGWERNVVIFGVAGLLSVAGLLLGGVMFGMVWTFAVLSVALFLSLGRFGPDRVTLEEWVGRRWRYYRSTRRYTYMRPGPPTPQPQVVTAKPTPTSIRPLTFAEDPGAWWGAVSVLLVIAGIVFVNWLRVGGDAELAQALRSLISITTGR